MVAPGLTDVVAVAVCGLVTGFGAMRGMIVGLEAGLAAGVIPGGVMLGHIEGATVSS
jgi:hypothetical protein